MIYIDGIPSLIESFYLGERIGQGIAKSNIIVNPQRSDYLYGKIIIYNLDNAINLTSISTLLDHGCKIISRIPTDYRGLNVDIQPYIMRVCQEVQWNGITLDCSNGKRIFDQIKDQGHIVIDQGILYFPKLISLKTKNLDCLGWISQQVGVNVIGDSKFIDLDLVKSGKVIKREL